MAFVPVFGARETARPERVVQNTFASSTPMPKAPPWPVTITVGSHAPSRHASPRQLCPHRPQFCESSRTSPHAGAASTPASRGCASPPSPSSRSGG